MLMQSLLAATGAAAAPTYSDSVFQAYTRTGTGADVTVTTGIDMTQGYMLWSKGRSGATTDHAIYDSARGVTYDLVSNSAAAQTTQTTGLKSVSATGHTVGSLAKMNTSAATYVDFVFRKAAKFFDVVTYTGTGGAQTVSHSLGQAPGMVIVKCTNVAKSWYVWHRGTATGNYLTLNSTAEADSTGAIYYFGNGSITVNPSSTVLYLGGSGDVNDAGNTYVAYLFAHDTGADGLIQCGSFTTDGSGNATVNLGWEPQYVLSRQSGAIDSWSIADQSRGFTVSSTTNVLQANGSAAEGAGGAIAPTASGFKGGFGNSATYIYLAIRRPNKPPTTGTQVYNAIARTGTGAAATVTGVGFAPDLALIKMRSGGSTPNTFWDRLRGASKFLLSTVADAETDAGTGVLRSFDQNGITLNTDGFYGYVNDSSGNPYINHFFKRAPGVFDVVCWTGDGGDAPTTRNHSLGVAPELVLMKRRDGSQDWLGGYFYPSNAIKQISLNVANGTYGQVSGSYSTYWTPSVFTPSLCRNSANTITGNTGANSYVAYLFATKSGISKVGSYTGNGTSQTINCGFTTGARFVLIKATSTTGAWTCIDTTRGLIAGSDPYLLLNSIAAEVTGEDCVDPDTTGFVVNETTAALNTNAVSYLYLAFA